ncbi:MAG: magnesium and cobalt transport protein CorA [Candidatus Rokuibacteriota bacterium]|nr:MAG: magnesium and cobalt transport protein CorA [Candidatus Rokubacteria bacterium]
MSAVVNSVAYAGGRRVGEVAIADISEVLKLSDRFVWIGLHEPDASLLAEVQGEFGLHDLAIEDAARAHQRPKLEREVRSRCEASPPLLARGPGFVLYSLMDFVVDQYFPVLDAFEDKLEALEGEIFGKSFDRATTERIYQLKRDLLEVKRAIAPLVDMCNRLVRTDMTLIPEDVRPYFRDVYDHVIRINEMIDTLRELLTTALEANLSLISVSQNEAMKRLAGWAAIFAVPTMIAGVYGMNFKFMPELEWHLGYPLVMGLMLGACGFLYYKFKRSGWL